MQKYYIYSLLFITNLSTPLAVFAQERDFKTIVGDLAGFFESLIPLLGGIALMVFFWGLSEYVFQAGNNQKVEAGKQRMTWGVIGLFVISTIWGIVSIISNSIGI